MKLIHVLLVLAAVTGESRAQTTRPIAAVDHVLIISIDGLRPDVMLRAEAPNLRRLLESGAFSLWALTIPNCTTLPSHTSMLTGVGLETHKIDFNDERATTRPIYPQATTIFELAKRAGYTTALVSGKSKFLALAKPGTVDWLSAPEDPKTTDDDVADHAGAVLRLHKPGVMFVHFPGADTAGHSKGWGSAEQLAAVARIDSSIGMLLNALQTSGMADHTVVIVTADHGGSGRQHGASVPDSRNIPWIAAGPGVRRNYDLTLIKDLTINTTDTFATACWLLGIPIPPEKEGKPITQVLPPGELLRDAPASNPTSVSTR